MAELFSLKAEVTQETDTWQDSSDGHQQLDIEYVDGYYIIKTERWAFETVIELTETLGKLRKAVGEFSG